LSNDIPAVTRREEELELHISDEDDDVLGQSSQFFCAFTLPVLLTASAAGETVPQISVWLERSVYCDSKSS